MPKDTRRAFLEALKKINEALAQRFSEAFAAIHSEPDLEALFRAIEAVDTVAIMEVLGLSAVGLEALREGVREAHRAGVRYQIERAPRRHIRRVELRVDPSHRRAEAWYTRRAGDLITELVEDQRVLIRDVIRTGIQDNRGYTAIRRDLIGTIQGNQRRGGLIGLHSRQARAVERMRAVMADPARLRAEFGGDPANWPFKRRHRGYDREIARAIAEGRAVSRSAIDGAARAYADRLLIQRGKTIARTEGNAAMNAGRAEAVTQMLENENIPARAAEVVWDATPDRRTRDMHRYLDGRSVQWGERFANGLRWPHDEGGAPEETINCRCSARFEVDWLSMAA